MRFIEFMPFGDVSLWNSKEIITSQQIQDVIKTIFDLTPSAHDGKGPARMFDIDGGSGKVGFISPVSTHICSECNRIRLTSNGMIRPCLFSDTEYDVKKLLRSGRSDEEIAAFVKEVVRVKPEKKLGDGTDQEVSEESARDRWVISAVVGKLSSSTVIHPGFRPFLRLVLLSSGSVPTMQGSRAPDDLAMKQVVTAISVLSIQLPYDMGMFFSHLRAVRLICAKGC